MGYTENDDAPANNPMLYDDVSTDCEPIVTNADLANMNIETYFGGYTNSADKTDDAGVEWGYPKNLRFADYDQSNYGVPAGGV